MAITPVPFESAFEDTLVSQGLVFNVLSTGYSHL